MFDTKKYYFWRLKVKGSQYAQFSKKQSHLFPETAGRNSSVFKSNKIYYDRELYSEELIFQCKIC